MAKPLLTGNPQVDFFGVALTSNWDQAVTLLTSGCTLQSPDETDYTDLFSGNTGNGTATIRSPLHLGQGVGGTVTASDGTVSLPNGYVTGGGKSNDPIANHAYTVTGVPICTFNLCTLTITMVFPAATYNNDQWSSLHVATHDGSLYSGGSYLGTDGTTTISVGPMNPDSGFATAAGTVDFVTAQVCADAGASIFNIAYNGAALIEDPGVVSATINEHVSPVTLTIVFKQAETSTSLGGVECKTAAGQGYAASAILSGGGTATHVYSLGVTGLVLANPGTLYLAGGVVTTVDAAENASISGFTLTETAGGGTSPPPSPRLLMGVGRK